MSDPNPLEHVVGTGRPARGQSLQRTLEQRNASWADADRLAEALRECVAQMKAMGARGYEAESEAKGREALRLHDAAKEAEREAR